MTIEEDTIVISIIIPAYNEEKRINNMLNVYVDYFLNWRSDCEIIVICDGNDNTAEIVKKMAEKCTRIKVFEFNSRLGKGGAIIEGFKKSNGQILGFTDADVAVPPYQFERLLSELTNYDCAIASRRVKGSQILKRQPLKREILSKIFNIIVNSLFDLKIKDTQCGAKVFKRDLVDRVLPKLKSIGFEFDVELLWRIKSEGFSIKEVPITWQHMDESSFSLKYAPKMFINLAKRRIGF